MTVMAVVVTAWALGCPIGWWLTWRRLGGAFTWRVWLGPWAYDRWFHDVNDRWPS